MPPLRCVVTAAAARQEPDAAIVPFAAHPRLDLLATPAGRAAIESGMVDVMEALLTSDGAVTREALLRRFRGIEIDTCFEAAKARLDPRLRALAAA